MKRVCVLLLLVLGGLANAQHGPVQDSLKRYGTSSCMGCHGANAMGGLGPPLAGRKFDYTTFLATIRKGKGMMPATAPADLPDSEVEAIYKELSVSELKEEQVPIAFKVGQYLSPANLSKLFIGAFGFFLIAACFGVARGIRLAGVGHLKPAIAKFGTLKALGVVLKSFVVDGLLVGSLWKSSRWRWFMHALMLYGFLGLMAADILIAIYNPQRSQLPLIHPLKLLPMLSGFALLAGVAYVFNRYKNDEYIDNGITLGQDFLFVNLLFHTAVSGFLTVLLKRMEVQDWVMPVYLYHIASIFFLVVTGPFTRFQHVYMAPTMAALTRLTEALTASGADLGFEREPCPGRHHKSQRIAEDVLRQIGEQPDGKVRLRYFP